MRVYLEKVGYRDSITDKEEIVWYWTQKAKFHPYKSHQTKYWINLFEMYKDNLAKSESFELLNFLRGKVTDEQLKNRELWRKKQKAQSDLELDRWKQFAVDRAEEKKLRSSLKNLN